MEEVKSLSDLLISVQPSLERIFFFGYPLWDVLRQEIPAYLAEIGNYALCYEFSAAIMFALFDESSAKLVRGYARSGPLWPSGNSLLVYTPHSWVEYGSPDDELVLDPCWLHKAMCGLEGRFWMPKAEYYKSHFVAARRIWTHAEFWRLEFSRNLRKILLDRQSSEQLSGLLCAYRSHYRRRGSIMFHRLMLILATNQEAQRDFIASDFVSSAFPPTILKILRHKMTPA